MGFEIPTIPFRRTTTNRTLSIGLTFELSMQAFDYGCHFILTFVSLAGGKPTFLQFTTLTIEKRGEHIA